MSEIKDELEHFAKELNIQDEAEAETPLPEVSKEDTAVQENFDDAYLEAPSNYQKEFAETFATLPPKWREYLHIREQEVDKGFQELRNRAGDYKWLDDAYASRADKIDGLYAFDVHCLSSFPPISPKTSRAMVLAASGRAKRPMLPAKLCRRALSATACRAVSNSCCGASASFT